MLSFHRKCCALMLLAALSGCTYLTPYKIEIQQGNVVTPEDLAQLKAGMSRQQVAQVLGTPLLSDVFHADRWDYVHYVRKRGKMTQQRQVTAIFEEDRLARLEGAGAPALPAAEAPAAAQPPPSEPTELPDATQEQSVVPSQPTVIPGTPGEEKK